MKVSPADALNACHPRGRLLIALLTTLAALTVGMYTLASTPAVAYQADPECNYDDPCDDVPDDPGGDAPDDPGGDDSGDLGGDEADDPDQDTADQDVYGDQLTDPPAIDPWLVQLADDRTSAPPPPAWEQLQERQRAIDRQRDRAEWADNIRDEAFSVIHRFDPDWEIWGDHNCSGRGFALRCGVGWIYLEQRAECRTLRARGADGAEKCERLETALWRMLDKVEQLAEWEGYPPAPVYPRGHKATPRN